MLLGFYDYARNLSKIEDSASKVGKTKQNRRTCKQKRSNQATSTNPSGILKSQEMKPLAPKAPLATVWVSGHPPLRRTGPRDQNTPEM